MTRARAARRTSSRQSISEAVSELPVGLSAAVFGFLLLAKLYAVGHYSLTTSAAIVGTSASNVLLGTLASYAYLVVSIGAFGCLHIWVRAGGLRLGPLWSIALLSGFVVLSLIAPLNSWAKVGGIFVAVNLGLLIRTPPSVSLMSRRKLEALASRSPAAKFLTRPWRLLRTRAGLLGVNLFLVIGGVTAFVWTVVPTIDQPWLAAEVIVLKNPAVTAQHEARTKPNPIVQPVLTGYIVGSGDEWTSILEADRRFLVRVPSTNIQTRYVCRANGRISPGTRPILQALRGEPYDSPNIDCATLRLRLDRSEIPVRQR